MHFPIALLVLGLGVQAAASAKRGPAWLGDAAAWLLWLGAAASWVAIGLGWLAEKTAPHVPAAWQMLEDHSDAAWWAAGSATLVAAWRYWLRRKGKTPGWGLVAAWAIAVAIVLRTAYLGGELVFRYGMGQLPEEAVQEPLHQ